MSNLCSSSKTPAVFPSPNLGLSLKSRLTSCTSLRWRFPSPNLGLSLKSGHRRTDSVGDIGFRPLIWGYLWNCFLYSCLLLFLAFPSPNLGLSLKSMYFGQLSGRNWFPSPNLGLSLKSTEKLWLRTTKLTFPSPNLGLSLKSVRAYVFNLIAFGFRPLIWGYLWNDD